MPGSRYKWFVVGMLWWISFFNYADRQAIFSVFPLLEHDMGLTYVEKGLLGSAFAWVYGLCAPFAGYMVDRVQRKTAILWGLQAWSVICMLTAFSRGLRSLVFFRAAEGLGETFYYPASVSMISDYHGTETRSRALGFHQTSVYLGTIGGGFFAGLIGQHYGWQSSFLVFGGMGVLLGIVLNRFLIEPPRASTKKRPFLETAKIAVRTPTIMLLLLAFLCANFVAMVLLSWMPSYLVENFGLSLPMAGLTATAYAQLASMVGSPLGGWLADSLRKRMPAGRILVQALGVLGGAPFVLLCGQTQSVVLLSVALTAWGFFKGLYDANIFASVFDVIAPEARGTMAGFMNMVGWLGGGASAPLVIGLLAQHYGLSWAISSAAGVYLVAAVFLFTACVFVRSNSRSPDET
jgi:MFS family permease